MSTTTSDQPRRAAFELPKRAGNKTSSIELVIGTTKFKCHPVIDGITLLEFAQLAGGLGGDPDNPDAEVELDAAQSTEAAGAILDLLRATIVDYPKFKDFVKKHGIEVETLGEYAAELVGLYTDRPQQ